MARTTIRTEDITASEVTTAKITDDAVTADKLANSINTEVTANTAKVTNATHTGDVTGATALTIAVDAVDIAMLSATGTADATTFLRGDNSWQVAGSSTFQTINLDGTVESSPVEGDIWYDSGVYYFGTDLGGAWSTGGNLGTGRHYLSGLGTQAAGMAIAGYTGAYSSSTEEYNGTTWSAGGALSANRLNSAAAGTIPAGLVMGGSPVGTTVTATSEEYNGTAWSAGGSMALARQDLAGAGTQIAALSMGGGATDVETEEYNGTAWSSGGNLATGRFGLGGRRDSDRGLMYGR